MKKIPLFLFAVLAICISAVAQPPQKKALRPDPRKKLDSVKYADVRDKLVQLAMDNPQLKIGDAAIGAANASLQKARLIWLNQIALSANLNEYNIQGKNSQFNNFFPKYNLGVQLPLGIFNSTSSEVKAAKSNIALAKATKDDAYRKLKAEVLTKYEDYLYYRQVYDLQAQIAEDSYTTYLTTQEKYKAGDITDDIYAAAFRAYNADLMSQKLAERNLNVAKAELERLTGVKLDDVLKQYNK
ncbi:MAG: TolC family protein [Chitinophagaceae bacterium]|nr:TolC family protein [Chitinophagaceae bacterium]